MELFKVNNSKLVVVLCTFYGCRTRVRQKYAELWVNKGASVITISNGIPDLNSSAIYPETIKELRERATAALDTLIANGLERQRVVFHLISEGGMSNWLQVMYLMDHHSKYSKIKENIVGYVLDSCPYHFSYLSTYRAIFGGFPFFKRISLMFFFTLKMALYRLIALLPFTTRFWPSLTFATMRAHREMLYTRYMGTLAQLFVWSSKDSICSPNYIADFVSRRKAQIASEIASLPSTSSSATTSAALTSSQGANTADSKAPSIIDTFVVNNAPHVHILRLHPKEYSTKIDEFIARLPETPGGKIPSAKI